MLSEAVFLVFLFGRGAAGMVQAWLAHFVTPLKRIVDSLVSQAFQSLLEFK